MADYLSHDYMGSLERSIKRFFDEKLELMESDNHPNKHYFIYKSIILNNLYGVDIMKEAVETAKLRLFLKLVSTAEPNYRAENFGIEPLPDIDFNIKAGNALIGFANEQEVQDALNYNLLGMAKISETIDAMLQMSTAVSRYKQLQLSEGDYAANECKEVKEKLSARQAELRDKLDTLLHDNDYGNVSIGAWKNNYLPFHWVSEFYSIIIDNGGFDVIIGNPPYVEKKTINYTIRGFETASTNNLFAWCLERSYLLSRNAGYTGFIIPISSFSTDKFDSLQKLVIKNFMVYISNYDDRPARLFEGLEHIQLSIVITVPFSKEPVLHTTNCVKWQAIERPFTFDRVWYSLSTNSTYLHSSIAKCSSEIELDILRKIFTNKSIQTYMLQEGSVIYYTRKVHSFLNILNFVPQIIDSRGNIRNPSEQKTVSFATKEKANIALCVYNSTLFRWFLSSFSDCRNLNRREMLVFPLSLDSVSNEYTKELNNLSSSLMQNILETSEMRMMRFGNEVLQVQCIIPRYSKVIIDKIDAILARHYDFTAEELDYIINYDIKYRLGQGAKNDDDE